MKRMLAALGGKPFEPTEEQRKMVRLLALNDTPHERIATILEIRLVELLYHFGRDLDLAKDAFVTAMTERMLELSKQNKDLGVAFRATELTLQTRSKAWRVPADTADHGKPVDQMSLTEVDNAIAELERRRRDAAQTVDAQAPTDDEPSIIH